MGPDYPAHPSSFALADMDGRRTESWPDSNLGLHWPLPRIAPTLLLHALCLLPAAAGVCACVVCCVAAFNVGQTM